MFPVTIENDAVHIGPNFAVTFQRTLRVPEDSRPRPLPPGLGRLPVSSVDAYADRIPPSWNTPLSFFVPLYQREALWLGFHGNPWKPNAVKIAIGGINVLTGGLDDAVLRDNPQDYLICPNQHWLDRVHTDLGTTRQFVARALGSGDPVLSHSTGNPQRGALRLTVFAPKLAPSSERAPLEPVHASLQPDRASEALALGAGGPMSQRVYPDPYGTDIWDTGNVGSIVVHILNSIEFQKLTGSALPPCPIDAGTYLRYGLPWFDHYDEHREDDALTIRLSTGEPIAEIDRAFARRGRRSTEPVVGSVHTDERKPVAEPVGSRDDARKADHADREPGHAHPLTMR